MAGFDEQPCDCRGPGPVSGSSGEDVELLYLVPERRAAPTMARLVAPDLTDRRAPVTSGGPE
ncbi:hypothetical protein [Streptomyces sp. MK37H]|uniref:hypothetical protein n=1 Tax=Streptomyces sp. MK37H TaxID=2699117 RepID=UPI001B38C890|nr:hypothetical protein [Streptomyces sp. MK37H]